MPNEKYLRSSDSLLAQRRHEMPIIDQARWSRRPGRISVWLRFLRPLVVTLVWLVAVRYVWNQFFGQADDLPVEHQVVLYSVAIFSILLAMAALAPLRQREFRHEGREEPGSDASPSTLGEISQFSNFPAHELGELQQAQRLVVHHDEDGALHRAEDTARLLREP